MYLAGFGKVEDGLRAAGGFGDPERWRFEWEWTYTRDAWLDQMPTTGVLTTAPPEAVAEVLAEVRGGHRRGRAAASSASTRPWC